MSDTHLKIKIYSHHFSVTRVSARGRDLCVQFAKKFAQWGWLNNRGHMQRVMTKIYGAATKNREEFRFHINQLPAFNDLLTSVQMTENLVERETESIYEAVATKMSVLAKWETRDYQVPVIEYLDAPEPISKMVDLQTGKGKGYVTMRSAANYGKRVVIIVKPMYMEKWYKEILEIYEDVEGEDVLMVRGGANLKALLQLGRENALDAKFIIISNKTFQGWLSEYEELGEYSLQVGYACVPHDFFKLMGAGIRIIDELHQDFHLNFKIDLYTHVPKSISLSATLLSEDPFLAKMYELAYPISQRFAGMPLDKYINSYSVYYRFDKPQKIRTEYPGASRGYSHTAFEESILKNIGVMNNYFKLIEWVMSIGFLVHPRPKKKVLIFCATIEMCTLLFQYLEARYGQQFVCKRYVGGDDFEDLVTVGEIICTTLGSAGTAVDVKDLTNVIKTPAVSSIKSNVQSLGRLRKLPSEEPEAWQNVEFHALYCTDFAKHMDYDISNQEMLKKRAKSFRPIHSGVVV